MIRALVVLAMTLVLGCASVQCPDRSADPHALCTHGVPNLRSVAAPGRPLIYRGGQPTVAGWSWLAAQAVAVVVKLNASSESFGQEDDVPATALGLHVAVCTIHPIDDGDPLELLRGPTLAQAADAVAALVVTTGPAYLHCTHGRDRTGLILGLLRVFVDGLTPAEARAEMDLAGYRAINRGLDRVWDGLFEDRDGVAHQAAFRALLNAAVRRRVGTR